MPYSYFDVYNPTTNSCDYEIYLTNPFNQTYYRQIRITSTNYGESASSVTSYVVYKNAPSSGTSQYVRGVVDDGLSAGRTYTLYAYAQAANGTWYRAGIDAITMLSEDKTFDYGISRFEVMTDGPYEIGEEIEIRARIRNYKSKRGPSYKVELWNKNDELLGRKRRAYLDDEESEYAYFDTTLEESELEGSTITYRLTVTADESGWRDTDRNDNEDTLEIEVESGEKFDYGIDSLEPAEDKAYFVGDAVRIVANIKNFKSKPGPAYKLELRNKNGDLLDSVTRGRLDGATGRASVSFSPTIKALEVSSNDTVVYTASLTATERGWRDTDPDDNEKKVRLDVRQAPTSFTKINESSMVYDGIISGDKWYYVIFAEDGKANFLLHPQVSNTDVDLEVFASDQRTMLGSSYKGKGTDDLVSEVPVKAGVRYYVRVSYVSGSGNYMIQCKNTPQNSNIMSKLQNNTSLGLTQSKKDTLIAMGNVLLSNGYELEFTSGILGNIMHEADVGKFENSNYSSSTPPSYINYINNNFNYLADYSNKNIKDVGVKNTKELVDKCVNSNYTGKFGLGCVQWTGGRNTTLVDRYISKCGANGFPTAQQCYEVEAAFIIEELKSAQYSAIYSDWIRDYKGTSNAVYQAGSMICIRYEAPANASQEAVARANSAVAIYNVLAN